MSRILYLMGLVLMAFVQLGILSNDSDGQQDSTEWSVSALCLPHAEIAVAQTVQIRVAFSTSNTGPTMTAWMNVIGMPTAYTNTTNTPYWGVPHRKWVSFIFEGPPISNKYFCQTEWGDKLLHLRYNQTNNMKIFFSPSGVPSNIELDQRESERHSVLTLRPHGEETTYSAGQGSNNPYWLQFAIPVYDVQSANSILFSDFL